MNEFRMIGFKSTRLTKSTTMRANSLPMSPSWSKSRQKFNMQDKRLDPPDSVVCVRFKQWYLLPLTQRYYSCRTNTSLQATRRRAQVFGDAMAEFASCRAVQGKTWIRLSKRNDLDQGWAAMGSGIQLVRAFWRASLLGPSRQLKKNYLWSSYTLASSMRSLLVVDVPKRLSQRLFENGVDENNGWKTMGGWGWARGIPTQSMFHLFSRRLGFLEIPGLGIW